MGEIVDGRDLNPCFLVVKGIIEHGDVLVGVFAADHVPRIRPRA